MSDEDAFLDRYALTNECVAGNLAVVPHFRVFLNLHESADLRFVADFTTVQVDELRQLDILAELYVGRDALTVRPS